MYVIYPADELICMTYGFFAPRVKPRPSLDCLREPLVPIEIPARSRKSNTASNIASSNSPTRASTSTTTAAVHFEDTPPPFIAIQPATAPPALISSYPGSPPASPPFGYRGSPTVFNFEEPPLVPTQYPYQYQSPSPHSPNPRAYRPRPRVVHPVPP